MSVWTLVEMLGSSRYPQMDGSSICPLACIGMHHKYTMATKESFISPPNQAVRCTSMGFGETSEPPIQIWGCLWHIDGI